MEVHAHDIWQDFISFVFVNELNQLKKMNQRIRSTSFHTKEVDYYV